MSQEDPLVFIYFSGRGKFQPVRNLVSYLDLNSYQVHLNNEETTKSLPEKIKSSLKNMKIDKTSLPVLVHKGYSISDTFPIISYLCRNFNPSLLGNGIRQKARVNQLLENVILKEHPTMLDIFALVQSSVNKPKDEITKAKRILFQKLMEQSGFLKEICEYIEKQQKEANFVFQDITVIDFYFMEICVRMLGFFKDLEEKKSCAIELFFKGIFNCHQNKQPNVKHISTMVRYLEFMRNQPFYKKNQKFLQQFSLICPKFSPQLVEGIRKMWLEDPMYIK